MPTATIDGIATHYEIAGAGPPLLMFAPGGFDASLDKWRHQGIYEATGLLARLTQSYRCILFDRREAGRSGGRVERVTWAHYAAQGQGLLDHLGIGRAHIMGGCMGCAPVLAFAVAWPERASSLAIVWPVGGARYRIAGERRFARHLAFVEASGLAGVVARARAAGKGFGADPEAGPWASVIAHEPDFAARYAGHDVERYRLLVTGMARGLFDRDTAPGAAPEDLLGLDVPALVVPGHDPQHATSAARYLEECLPRADYWDMAVAGQTAATLPARVLAFLDSHP